MGILDPIKKLLFGVKGVTKHQAEKAVDYTKEKGEEFFDKTVDFVKDTGEKIGKQGAKILDKVDDLWETKTTSETPFAAQEPGTEKKESEFVEPIRKTMGQVGEKVSDTFSKVKEEAKDLSGKFVEVTDDFWKKAESFSENLTDKAKTKGSELYEKAKDFAQEKSQVLNQKIDEFIEREKAIEAKEPKGEFAEKPIAENKNLTEPLMTKHEDFFDKAKKFLDNHEKKPAASVPVDVEVKKVNPLASTDADKPLDPQEQKQLNDLLSHPPLTKPEDHIEDADIIDEAPKA